MAQQLTVDFRSTLCVARQPILDSRWQVFGYELLYRADGPGTAVSLDRAVARVLTDAVLNVGLDALTGGRPAFLNLSRSLLVGEAWRLLPPAEVVFELHRNIPVDSEVAAMCAQLHQAGYALAVADFGLDAEVDALLPFAKFVKVDMVATPRRTHAAIADYVKAIGPKLIAENVETESAFDAALAAGYELFQGHFFCLPRVCTAAVVPAERIAYMQLLAALNRPKLSLSEVEDLIKHDVSLSYRVLRCINSAAFGLRREIHSIREAVLLLGVEPIRSWASVWCLAGLNAGGTTELTSTALVRARSCELLGEHLDAADGASELFLIGLCSLLDAMLGRPLEDAIAELPLSAEARAAVLGEGTKAPRWVLEAIVAYENGQWDEAAEAAAAAGLSPSMLPAAYNGALAWARQFSREALAAA
jgi:EAL and modified HD-GYP domain-containing signal transduction protein